MELIRNLVPLLPLILPVLGKLMLVVPVIPNKIIPFVNAAVATIAKYWFLSGFGVLGEVAPPVDGAGVTADTISMAGVFGTAGIQLISLAWGTIDALAAHYFYEGKRALAAKAGKVSWLEKGKSSLYTKKG